MQMIRLFHIPHMSLRYVSWRQNVQLWFVYLLWSQNAWWTASRCGDSIIFDRGCRIYNVILTRSLILIIYHFWGEYKQNFSPDNHFKISQCFPRELLYYSLNSSSNPLAEHNKMLQRMRREDRNLLQNYFFFTLLRSIMKVCLRHMIVTIVFFVTNLVLIWCFLE